MSAQEQIDHHLVFDISRDHFLEWSPRAFDASSTHSGTPLHKRSLAPGGRSATPRFSQSVVSAAFRLVLPIVAAVFVSLLPDTAWAVQDEHPSWTRSGDWFAWGLPLAGLGISLMTGTPGTESKAVSVENCCKPSTSVDLNWPGPRLEESLPRNFIVSFARALITTQALKYAVDERRPNGEGLGFPSGHSARAFMGAEFIRLNAGNAWGVPAYLTASWVGYTRVEAHKHYWHDVLGGALVGIASNYDLDEIRTPWGELRVGPSLTVPNTAPAGPDGGAGCSRACSPHAGLIPTLRFELRF